MVAIIPEKIQLPKLLAKFSRIDVALTCDVASPDWLRLWLFACFRASAVSKNKPICQRRKLTLLPGVRLI